MWLATARQLSRGEIEKKTKTTLIFAISFRNVNFFRKVDVSTMNCTKRWCGSSGGGNLIVFKRDVNFMSFCHFIVLFTYCNSRKHDSVFGNWKELLWKWCPAFSLLFEISSLILTWIIQEHIWQIYITWTGHLERRFQIILYDNFTEMTGQNVQIESLSCRPLWCQWLRSISLPTTCTKVPINHMKQRKNN